MQPNLNRLAERTFPNQSFSIITLDAPLLNKVGYTQTSLGESYQFGIDNQNFRKV